MKAVFLSIHLDGEKPRSRRTVLLAALLTCSTILLAACTGNTKPNQSTATATQQPGPLAFAACMRSSGISNFPDPNADGQFVLTQNNGVKHLNGVAVDIDSAKFQAAYDACKSKLPPSSNSAGNDQMTQALVKFAACMRKNGVPNFPDPTQQDGKVKMGSGGLDPNSPEFQKAMETCRPELAGLMGGAGQ